MSDEVRRRPGESDEEYVDRLFAVRRAEDAAELAAARAESHARGKEPFDLDKLESMWMPIKYGRYMPSREDRQATWEPIYYLQHPEIATLAEFAKEMEKLDLRGVFD